ncbi:MAG: hypothetical protein M0D55_03135 [Elusimicrobiota bacterium]|nr:MAG: hypothetical protein M0D55_03135 [Elusimicrobiota bacterium]
MKKPFDPSKKWEKKSFDPAKKKPFGAKPFKKPWDKNASGDKPASKTVPPLRGEKWFPKKD